MNETQNPSGHYWFCPTFLPCKCGIMLWLVGVQNDRCSHRAATPFRAAGGCSDGHLCRQGLCRGSWADLQLLLRAALSNNMKATGCKCWWAHILLFHLLQMQKLEKNFWNFDLQQVCWVMTSECVLLALSKYKLKLIAMLWLAAYPWMYITCYWIISFRGCTAMISTLVSVCLGAL